MLFSTPLAIFSSFALADIAFAAIPAGNVNVVDYLGRQLNLAGPSTADLSPVISFPASASGFLNQQWIFNSTAANTFTIQNGAASVFLSYPTAGSAGARVQDSQAVIWESGRTIFKVQILQPSPLVVNIIESSSNLFLTAFPPTSGVQESPVLLEPNNANYAPQQNWTIVKV